MREGLTNCCAHADYFSPMHPTICVFSDRIELQNPGRFMFPLPELRTQIHSIPRNPNLIKFFRYAKLGENAGYGIDKMLVWETSAKRKVEFTSDLISSTITYWLGEQAGEEASEQVQQLVNVIRENAFTLFDIQVRLKISSRSFVQMKLLKPAIEGGYVLRVYPDKPSHPKQRYYLSEKGLKLIK